MTSKGLETALHKLNGSNGHAHVSVWVNGQTHDVVGVEREGNDVHVIARAKVRTMEQSAQCRTTEDHASIINGHVDEQSIPARKRML